MYGLYKWNGWYFVRIGRRTFRTRWGATRRALRASRLLHCVIVVSDVADMEADPRYRPREAA